MNRNWFFTLSLLLLVVVVNNGCNKKSTNNAPKASIEGSWFLKTSSGNPVFARNKEDLGPRRFYTLLLFNEDGTFEWVEPGPTDLPKKTSGYWKWESQTAIRFKSESGEQIITIIQLDSTNLALDKLPK